MELLIVGRSVTSLANAVFLFSKSSRYFANRITPNKLHVLQNVLPDTRCVRRYMDTRHSEFGFITAIHLHATSTKHPLTTSECCIFVSGLLATS